jgi:hypothetical protein
MEDGNSRFLRGAGSILPGYTAKYLRRQRPSNFVVYKLTFLFEFGPQFLIELHAGTYNFWKFSPSILSAMQCMRGGT